MLSKESKRYISRGAAVGLIGVAVVTTAAKAQPIPDRQANKTEARELNGRVKADMTELAGLLLEKAGVAPDKKSDNNPYVTVLGSGVRSISLDIKARTSFVPGSSLTHNLYAEYRVGRDRRIRAGNVTEVSISTGDIMGAPVATQSYTMTKNGAEFSGTYSQVNFTDQIDAAVWPSNPNQSQLTPTQERAATATFKYMAQNALEGGPVRQIVPPFYSNK